VQATAQLAGDERRQHQWGLLGLVAGLAIGGATLLAIAGPPHLPAELPDRTSLARTLNGTHLAPEAVRYVVTTVAWVIWGWLTLSLALRLVVVGAEIVAQGASWVRALRLISDRLTLPVVRRLVDGAVVTVLVVNLMARAAPAQASPLPLSAVTVTALGGMASEASPARHTQESSGRTVRYTVQAGDTLWSISERFYGTGFEYKRLLRANAGHSMSDGSRFTRTGVIQPGWTLNVPLPSKAIEVVEGRTYYVVEDEDTLRGVAARLLGDEEAWQQIFEANRQTAGLPDGRTLTEPDLIWPGLRLLIPIVVADGGQPAPAATQPVPEEPPPTPPTEPPTPVSVVPTPEPPTVTPEVGASPEPEVLQPVAPPDLTAVATVIPVPDEPAATPVLDPTPGPTEAAEIEPAAPASDDTVRAVTWGAAILGALAAAVGAVCMAMRGLRRRITEPWMPDVPEIGPATNEGFAEPELARVLEHRIHGGEVEPAVIVAGQAMRLFEEHDVSEVDVVTVGQRRTAVSLTLSAGLAAQPRVLELAPELGSRLGGTGEVWRTADHDILLRISGLSFAGLTPLAAERPTTVPALLPVGMLPGRETLYANWHGLGHVLVAGLPGGGVETALTSLIGALTARCRPEEIRLVTIASHRMLPAAIVGLPHQSDAAVDPAEQDAVTEILQELRDELDRRIRPRSHDGFEDDRAAGDKPEIVVVIGELADVAGDGTTFELLGVHGAAHGIRLLAASTRPEAVGEELLAHFTTRVALQMLDEDASIRLIGRPDAADLGGGGDLIVRIDGRVPLRARGFRLSPEHLEQLVRVMQEAYVASTASTAPVASSSGRDVASQDDSTRSEVSSAASSDRTPPSGRVGSATVASAQDDPDADDESPVQLPDPQIEVRVNGSHTETVSPASPEPSGHGDEVVGVDSDSHLPIKVSCFGTFRVTVGDRELSANGSDGAHYKAWENLAFLCAQPGGTVSRERLVGALWPDVVSRKAANRLKVSLTRLRGILKKQVPGLLGEVVRVERNGVCHLNSEYISSDVHRFMALRRLSSAQQSADAIATLEEARELYRGDLLTEPYYEWVHTRMDDGLTLRELYRQEYFRATQRLAELYRQQGELARAVACYREILKLEPTLEEVARSLYRCYGELGDRGALVREHRRLRDAIRQMMSSSDDPDDFPELYEPESETVALYEQILADLEARSAVGRSA